MRLFAVLFLLIIQGAAAQQAKVFTSFQTDAEKKWVDSV
jgi:hypothetical protein